MPNRSTNNKVTKERTTSGSRIFWAFGLGVISLLFVLSFALRFSPFWLITEAIPPGPANANRPLRDGFFQFIGMVAVSVTAATIFGALVYDPKFGSKAERTVIIVAFCSIAAVSGVNFWSGDALMNWKAQLILDAIQVIFAIAMILVLVRWKPQSDLLTGIRFLALYCVSAFGLILPLLYGTVAALIIFGMEGLRDQEVESWIKILSLIMGLPAAVLAVVGLKPPTPTS